jgi:hypothetical protein
MAPAVMKQRVEQILGPSAQVPLIRMALPSLFSFCTKVIEEKYVGDWVEI